MFIVTDLVSLKEVCLMELSLSNEELRCNRNTQLSSKPCQINVVKELNLISDWFCPHHDVHVIEK